MATESLMAEALALHNRGDLAGAVLRCQQILSEYPDEAAALNLLGVLHAQAGDPTSGVPFVRRATEIRPGNADYLLNLGLMLRQAGAGKDAFAPLKAACDLPDAPPAAVHALSQFLVQHGNGASALWEVEPLARLRQLDEANDDKSFRDALFEEQTLRALTSGAIGLVLTRCVIPDAAWEALLTRIRSVLLDVVTQETGGDHPFLRDAALGCVLAQQCWLNGFVFFRSSQEEIRVRRLSETLLAEDTPLGPTDIARLSVVACYEGLIDWQLEAEAIDLGKAHPADSFVDLLIQQVAEPIREEEIALGVTGLGDDGVSSHADARPYPRWVSIEWQAPRPLWTVLAERFPHADLTGETTNAAPLILVAGCGTGRHLAQIDRTFLHAGITGIDSSRARLAYAARMLEELGCEGLELFQADITKRGDWNLRFDLIDGSGGLHHLADPLSGWRALERLLKPGGLMKLALHSELARGSIMEARDLIAKREGGSTPGEVRVLRRDILNEALPVKELMQQRSFWSLEECRDLIYPIHEQHFTVPQLSECVSELGLEFIGFEIDRATLGEFGEHYSAEALQSLEAWHTHEMESPDTFRDMYQFWLRKPMCRTLSE